MAHSILSEGPYGPLRREGEEFQTVVMISGGACSHCHCHA